MTDDDKLYVCVFLCENKSVVSCGGMVVMAHLHDEAVGAALRKAKNMRPESVGLACEPIPDEMIRVAYHRLPEGDAVDDCHH